jgi:hypothetical protein
MENMVVRSILAMFVCLSMAACGTSKSEGAPVHRGTNAKVQQKNAPGRTAAAPGTANAQNAGQATEVTDAQIATFGSLSSTAKTTFDDGTTETVNEYANGNRVSIKTNANGQVISKSLLSQSTVADQDDQADQDQSDTKSEADQKAQAKAGNKAVAKPVTKAAGKTTTTTKSTAAKKAAPAGGYQPGSTTTASNSGSATKTKTAKKQKTNPIPTTDNVSNGTINRLQASADRYTGSADDYLRNLLLNKEDRESDAQKTKDLETAASVRSASLKVDFRATNGGGSGRAALTLVVSQGGVDRSLQLNGAINNGRTRLASNQGNVAVKGEIICMDADATTCETAVADLVVGSQNTAKLRIIFRHTDVHLNAKFPNRNCATQECEDIYTMFSESAAYETGAMTSPDRLIINRAKMDSFEVINGRSGFRVVLNTIGNEVIAFGGPLYTHDLMTSAAVNVPADRTINIEDQINLHTGVNYKTRLNNTLKDIRIVDNDGMGTISLNVTTDGQKQIGLQDQFQLTIERIAHPLRPMIGTNLAGN